MSQRGHVFSSSFGAPGAGDGQLNQPGQVAVNETTGDVYVADTANNRIERFGSDGSFIAAWGFGVSNGAQEFQICTSACKAGTGKGALTTPGAIAVDNSSGPSAGDVYVVMDSRLNTGALWKFNAAGGAPGEAKKPVVIKQEGTEPKWEGALDGVAVDSTGNLWVYRSGEEPIEGYVEGFNGKEEEKLTKAEREEKEAKGEGRGEANEYREVQLEPTLESEAVIARREGEEPFCPKPGFAVDALTEHFYIDHERINAEEECPEQRISEEEKENKKAPPVEKPHGVAPALFTFDAAEALLEGAIASLNHQRTSAIAVDQKSDSSTPLGEIARGDAYFASETTLAAVDSSGRPIQRVTLPGSTPAAGGVAIDAKTGDVYVVDTANGQVDVFTPAPAGAPSVDSVFPQNLTANSTKIFAQVDPNGADTHVRVQFGTESCLTHPSACTDVPAAPGADIGSGFGDRTFEATLEGLQPDTAYFYRVIAQGNGEAESAEAATTFFTTLPSAAGLLADHREWEMVSPPAKAGPLTMANDESSAIFQSSLDGNGFTFGAINSAAIGEAAGSRAIQTTQLLFTRNSGGWSTQNITTPHNKGEGFQPNFEPPEYLAFSPELALSLVWPEARVQFTLENPALAPPMPGEEAGHQEKTIYVRANAPIAPSASETKSYEEAAANREYLAPGYLALVTQINDTAHNPFAKGFGEEQRGFISASSDLNHVVVSSAVPLTAGATGPGLYEWNSESPSHALALVSSLPGPGEQAASGAQLGAYGNTRHAISDDGTRVIFTAANALETDEGAHLYLRDMATHETTAINAVQGSHSEPTPIDEESEEIAVASYQTATNDGSRIFFKDTWPLTDDSKLAPTGENHPSDLYEYDVAGKHLTDLTVDPHNGETADVLGTIPGASEDGSYVYFVANGALTADATPGNCPRDEEAVNPAASCNLYVLGPNPTNPAQRETRLVARVSGSDASDWSNGPRNRQGKLRGNLSYLTSRVSPNGRYIAFMSEQSLTGYDNEDATSKTPGERMDEEVFLFDAQLGRLVCASCNPDASKRPTGVFDTAVAGEGVGLLVDRSSVWDGSWLAGSIPGWTPLVPAQRAIQQPAYLSDSGRLFFNSADSLVSQDVNHRTENVAGVNETVGVEDVYQFEPNGVGTCAAAPGCVTLASSGTDERESAFLSASETGDDAFFLTSAKLLGPDVDSSNDIYDARVCGTSGTAACLPPFSPPPPECQGENCKAAAPTSPSFGGGATATFSGPGNTPSTGVLNNKTKSTPKKLTRAQQLAKALKACKKLKKKSKRVACEKQARKKYGTKKAKKKSKASRAKRHASSATGARSR